MPPRDLHLTVAVEARQLLRAGAFGEWSGLFKVEWDRKEDASRLSWAPSSIRCFSGLALKGMQITTWQRVLPTSTAVFTWLPYEAARPRVRC